VNIRNIGLRQIPTFWMREIFNTLQIGRRCFTLHNKKLQSASVILLLSGLGPRIRSKRFPVTIAVLDFPHLAISSGVNLSEPRL